MEYKQPEINGQLITPPNESQANEQMLTDSKWVKIAFMVPNADFSDDTDVVNRFYSSASAKYTDARIGCNIGINSKPQWTRYADIRVKGRLSDRNDVSLTNISGNYGMGRAYSEALDDPAQKIFLRFGVPKFNSLINFMTNAFSREQVIMARTGRAPSAWYTMAKVVGTAIPLIAFPALTIGVFVGKAINSLAMRPTYKFFTVKPTMFMYWSMVQTLVMNHAVNTGIIKRIFSSEDEQKLGKPYKIDEASVDTLAQLMPDVFRAGRFDIISMATKAQRLANQLFEKDYAALGRDDASDFEGYVKKDFGSQKNTHSTYLINNDGNIGLYGLIDHITKFGKYYTTEKDEGAMQEMDPRIAPDKPPPEGGSTSPIADHIESMKHYSDAEYRQGAEFAIFRVCSTGSVQESFGNSTTESDLAQKFNGVSSQFKEARFTLADGNLFGGVIQDIQNAVTNVAAGALDGATLGFAGLISGLGGSGYIDIPKHWQSSSATLPRGSYKVQLISPYNNAISRMINIWIPFYMLLAGILPRSTGKSSYTSPFYCQLFDRGRVQSKCCMIESLSVTRGTSNLPFDTQGQALALDVTFDIVDLSTIMHMPISSGDITELDMAMDDDNITMDYLNTLAGMDIYSQIYAIPKAQLAFTKKLAMAKHKATSPAYHAALLKNSMSDGFINDITLGASGLIVGLGETVNAGGSNYDGNKR
jgi:hypothetical protein